MRYTTRIIVPPRVRRSGMPGGPGGGPRPQPIGVRKSFGFGDRFGLAAAGQVAVASEHLDFAPFFAQHSAKEAAAIGRTPVDTLAAAARAVGNARYRPPWGADADLLHSPHEVDEAATAGFTHFTIDLSEHVRSDEAELTPDGLAASVGAMIADGVLREDWASPYADRALDLPGAGLLRLDLPALRRAAVRFARAITHGARMYETIARANRGRPYEIEVSLDRTAGLVSKGEHLFIGLELESRGVRLTGLSLPFDDRDPPALESTLREHVAVASFCGPYKLSFRSGTHDPAVVPLIGRCCGDLLHYKTSAESHQEALRLAWRWDPRLFAEIIASAGGEIDPESPDFEARCFEGPAGGGGLNFLAGFDRAGPVLQARLLELLEQRADVYQELLVARYERLFRSLNAG